MSLDNSGERETTARRTVDIPPEILMQILKKLSIFELKQCRYVNSFWNEVAALEIQVRGSTKLFPIYHESSLSNLNDAFAMASVIPFRRCDIDLGATTLEAVKDFAEMFGVEVREYSLTVNFFEHPPREIQYKDQKIGQKIGILLSSSPNIFKLSIYSTVEIAKLECELPLFKNLNRLVIHYEHNSSKCQRTIDLPSFLATLRLSSKSTVRVTVGCSRCLPEVFDELHLTGVGSVELFDYFMPDTSRALKEFAGITPTPPITTINFFYESSIYFVNKFNPQETIKEFCINFVQILRQSAQTLRYVKLKMSADVNFIIADIPLPELCSLKTLKLEVREQFPVMRPTLVPSNVPALENLNLILRENDDAPIMLIGACTRLKKLKVSSSLLGYGKHRVNWRSNMPNAEELTVKAECFTCIPTSVDPAFRFSCGQFDRIKKLTLKLNLHMSASNWDERVPAEWIFWTGVNEIPESITGEVKVPEGDERIQNCPLGFRNLISLEVLNISGLCFMYEMHVMSKIMIYLSKNAEIQRLKKLVFHVLPDIKIEVATLMPSHRLQLQRFHDSVECISERKR